MASQDEVNSLKLCTNIDLVRVGLIWMDLDAPLLPPGYSAAWCSYWLPLILVFQLVTYDLLIPTGCI